MNLAEAGTLLVIAVPALSHQVVDLARAGSWLRQDDLSPVTVKVVAQVVQHLFICQLLKWPAPGQGQGLPQGHGK